jgi:release factor glutamine methyltransferase
VAEVTGPFPFSEAFSRHPVSPPAKDLTVSTDAVPSPDQWTVRRVLEWTIGHLKKHGSDSPRLDAEVLLAHARGCSRIQLYTAYDEVLSEPIRQKMRELVKRRTSAEPVAYLVGMKEFYSLPFEVNRHTLVPRPETELLVMEGLKLLKPLPAPRILELGVGSGCISTAIAVNHKGAQIVGIELNPDTRDVAQRNLERHKVADRVELRCGDLFTPLTQGEQFDLLISNPPYVPTAEIAQLDPTVREHEPHGALDGGADGLDCIRRIAAGAADFLRPGGWILLEFSPEQADAVRQILTNNRWEDVSILNDLGQVARAACARRGE